MRHFRLALTALVLASASTNLLADNTIPYGNPGTLSSTFIINATNTGSVLGYFAGSEAGGTDFIRLFNVTNNTFSAWVLNNHTSATGELYDFGSVTVGDTLVFQLLNANGQVVGSDPTYSVDGTSHAYVTPFSGGTIPGQGGFNFGAGLYVGMEDLLYGFSDLDYNDDSFIFQNVAATEIPNPPAIDASPVPEPSSLVMFGTGILAAAGAMRRKIIGR